MGAVTDLGVDIQGAEKEIERKFTSTSPKPEVEDIELKGTGVGSSRAGREKVF
jgi:hypothetical protein